MKITQELQRTADGSHEALPPEIMAPLADELASLEAQIELVSTDRQAVLQDEKQRMLERLLGDKIGETLINEVVYLAQLYEGRTSQRELDDGSSLYQWGTRDADNQYLAYKYYVLTQPDGHVLYTVLETTPEGQTIYKLQDSGEYQVFRRAPMAAGMAHFRAVEQQPRSAEASMQALFGTSLATAGIVRARSDGENQAADVQARGMLGGNETDRLLETATDARDAYIALELLHAQRDVPYNLAFRAVRDSYARR